MTSIFVTKLDFNTTDAELKTLFEQYGKVNRVTIAKDRETGKPRGFAFVEMFNEPEAEAAISELDNSTFNGRSIAVKKADDRGARPQGGNSQGGGFNRTDNRSNDRGERPQFNRPPRTDGQQSDFRQQERPPRREDSGGGFAPAQSFDAPAKTERKKETKASAKKSTSDQPKQHKMEAYRKSGKSNRFFDDDDDLDEDWQSHRRDRGWDEEE